MDLKPILLTRVYVTPMRLKKSPTSEPAAIQREAVDRLAGSVVHAVLAQQKLGQTFQRK